MPAASIQSPEARLLRGLVRLDGELVPRLPPGVPHLPAAEARLAAGLPALLEEPVVDLAGFREALSAVERVLGADAQFSSIRPTVEWLMADEEQGSLLAAAAAAGDWDAVQSAATRQGLDPYATVVVLDHLVRPWLRLAAKAVSPLIAASGWSRGNCPACGAPPVLAELRGGARERVLRCSRCATAWGFPRLACPGCGERRHQRLSYLHDDGQAEFRRADVCQTCRSYLKAIAVLDPLTPLELLEADLASVALDFAALERGYHRA